MPSEMISPVRNTAQCACMVFCMASRTSAVGRRQVRHLNSQMAGEAPPSDDADLLIHPDDAAAAGVEDGRPVRVVGVSGSVVATARVVDAIAAGSVSLPHGYGDPNVGRLTTSRADLDPLTGMPVQSGLPVTLEVVDA